MKARWAKPPDLHGRTPEAASLSGGSRDTRVQGGGPMANSGPWNLLINGTSTGLSGEMPALLQTMTQWRMQNMTWRMAQAPSIYALG